MEVLKLSVQYDGYYGGHVDETVLLPIDINGVFFEELKEGYYEDKVYLGEIEGKHSEVYGDLDVEIVDLDSLSVDDATHLINKSDASEFESYFEGVEEEFEHDYEDEYDQAKVIEVLQSYGLQLESWEIKASAVHDKFIEQLKEKYVKRFKTITVLEEDYDRAVDLLDNGEIRLFQ